MNNHRLSQRQQDIQIMDKEEEVKIIARKILDQYDIDGGFLGHLEISSMISDSYQSFNKEYLPNKQDVDAYIKNINPNSKGEITYDDLLQIVQKYLLK